MRVVKDDIGRESLDNPFVLEAFIRSKSFLRVPLKASRNEVNESWIRHLSELVHYVSQPLLFLFLGQYFEWCWHSVVFELREKLFPL